LHRSGELTRVWVPDEAHEAMRDLTRHGWMHRCSSCGLGNNCCRSYFATAAHMRPASIGRSAIVLGLRRVTLQNRSRSPPEICARSESELKEQNRNVVKNRMWTLLVIIIGLRADHARARCSSSQRRDGSTTPRSIDARRECRHVRHLAPPSGTARSLRNPHCMVPRCGGSRSFSRPPFRRR
jgi:hypothetical protein